SPAAVAGPALILELRRVVSINGSGRCVRHLDKGAVAQQGFRQTPPRHQEWPGSRYLGEILGGLQCGQVLAEIRDGSRSRSKASRLRAHPALFGTVEPACRRKDIEAAYQNAVLGTVHTLDFDIAEFVVAQGHGKIV